ncbi:response regulator transcription factor [Burkholderia cenocepacia]|uniref:response regulator transcription factor n=1 Tax=Burkholderia cenocepacia TaxID=95486 RepID=UPI001F276DA9|nr:response regulator transcription factor [Burkholderia cenocepacia]MCF1369923.1 response regulator transcription factor [Burkholderia cenocepacia]MCF1386046.1 response regulator transcription factor [Burkholderia cenocepacia]
MNRTFPIRIVIADDHPAVVIGARYELSATNTVAVVATAHNSTELMDALSNHPCDVLVSDYAMPGTEYGDGLAMFTTLLKRFPGLKIVVMTMMENAVALRALIDIGIACIVSKSDMPNHLTMAIHAAYTNGRYLSPSMDRILRNTGSVGKAPALSVREVEVIRLFASGLSVNEIAEKLNRSKKTISTQKSSAMQKLGIERDVDLVRYAIACGLVTDYGYAPPVRGDEASA